MASIQTITHVKLLRSTHRVTHLSTLDRIREIEFTVENPSDKVFEILWLPPPGFLRNLRVFDEDGRRLSFLPNSYVKSAIAEMKTSKPKEYEYLEHRFASAKYKLVVVLPGDHLLNPKQLRTIRLEFEEEDPPRIRAFFKNLFKDWFSAFFSIQTFHVKGDRLPGLDHEKFIKLVGLPTYEIRGTMKITGSRPSQTIYEDGMDDCTRVASVRFPPADNGAYDWRISYDLVPARHLRMGMLIAFFWIGTVLGLISLLAAFGGGFGNHILTLFGPPISGALAAASLGIMLSTEDLWMDRFKFLLLITILLNVAAWIIWRPLLLPV